MIMVAKGAELDRILKQEIVRRTDLLSKELTEAPKRIRTFPFLRKDVAFAFIKLGDTILKVEKKVIKHA